MGTPHNKENTVYTPEAILPAGIDSAIVTNPYTGESAPARKGTVAATLNNVALLNQLLKEDVSPEKSGEVQKVVQAVMELVPSLKVVGIFNLFTVQEWLETYDQPGRTLVGVLYLQQHPREITPTVKSTLINLQKETKIKYLRDEIAKALKNI